MILISFLTTIILTILFIKIGIGLFKILFFLIGAGLLFYFVTFLYLPLIALTLILVIVGLILHQIIS